ncbi:low-temperature-induced 65 kDa protein-like [Dendrobium catenatum]|uniref:Low-temperature-induced 65 kDa protein n=1 Tax=Dendrobium catenatum TaxID=906689 RepID=A0A2I0VMD4_9ASPA|nr:low-temperature-induced 65 kDa protein-like [Dendrobium catenatum]PKU64543.1 Low-temperature-induced 65 kDa protein [Dendrobium catenatum]
METVTAPSTTYLQGENPPQTVEEQEHHEKKPVMKKVKDKVKKIKNAITKKSHGHGDEGVDDDTYHQHGDLDEGDDGFVEDDEMSDDPEVHGAPMYESSAIGMRTGGKEMLGGRGGGGAGLGLSTTKFDEDPDAPRTETDTITRGGLRRGGEEVDVSPELSRSLEAMTISAQNDRGETELPKDQNSSYTSMVSSAASKVYGLVADAGSAVISKVKPEARKDVEDDAVEKQDKGLSIKEYITEKLTPGEDEKALSELITEAGQMRTNEAVEAPPATEKSGFGEGGSGAGVMERLKETVTSLLGGGDRSPKSSASEAHSKVAQDNKDVCH